LTAARRSGQVVIATGGSGGNITRSATTKKTQNQDISPPKGLDRSLHISFRLASFPGDRRSGAPSAVFAGRA
jgi:hypothetical protein